MIDLLAEYGFYELVASYLDKINDSDKKNRLRVQILLYETKYDEALQIVDEMIEKDNKNMELLLIKSEICYRSEKLFECE